MSPERYAAAQRRCRANMGGSLCDQCSPTCLSGGILTNCIAPFNGRDSRSMSFRDSGRGRDGTDADNPDTRCSWVARRTLQSAGNFRGPPRRSDCLLWSSLTVSEGHLAAGRCVRRRAARSSRSHSAHSLPVSGRSPSYSLHEYVTYIHRWRYSELASAIVVELCPVSPLFSAALSRWCPFLGALRPIRTRMWLLLLTGPLSRIPAWLCCFSESEL